MVLWFYSNHMIDADVVQDSFLSTSSHGIQAIPEDENSTRVDFFLSSAMFVIATIGGFSHLDLLSIYIKPETDRTYIYHYFNGFCISIYFCLFGCHDLRSWINLKPWTQVRHWSLDPERHITEAPSASAELCHDVVASTSIDVGLP